MSKVIEVPVGKRSLKYRFFEILPLALSAAMIALLFILSAINPVLASAYLLVIVIMSFVKAIGVAVRTIQGYKLLKRGVKVNWSKRLNDLEDAAASYDRLVARRVTRMTTSSICAIFAWLRRQRKGISRSRAQFTMP